jgi:excisionase family DNA binding protein
MTSPESLLTTEEVAAAVRQDTNTVARWARDGLIPAIKLPGGRWRFRREVVDAILRGETPVSGAA